MAEEFNYMLLDRLKQDCEYYLNHGNKCNKHLWAGSVEDQIYKMIELWNSFPLDKKPDWLTLSQIEEYKNRMMG